MSEITRGPRDREEITEINNQQSPTHFIVWFDRLKGMPGIRLHTLPCLESDRDAVNSAINSASRVSTGAFLVYGYFPIEQIHSVSGIQLNDSNLLWKK